MYEIIEGKLLSVFGGIICSSSKHDPQKCVSLRCGEACQDSAKYTWETVLGNQFVYKV